MDRLLLCLGDGEAAIGDLLRSEGAHSYHGLHGIPDAVCVHSSLRRQMD